MSVQYRNEGREGTGESFYPIVSERFPLPLASAVYGQLPNPSKVIADVKKTSETDPFSGLGKDEYCAVVGWDIHFGCNATRLLFGCDVGEEYGCFRPKEQIQRPRPCTNTRLQEHRDLQHQRTLDSVDLYS